MSLLYVSCVLVVNAVTGERLQEFCQETPVTLEQCSKKNIEFGPVKAMGGQAVVLYCRKVDGGVET